MTVAQGNYTISTDRERLDREYIHRYLSQVSYWAKDVPADVVNRSIENSLCFGLYDEEKQIGFARMCTKKSNKFSAAIFAKI